MDASLKITPAWVKQAKSRGEKLPALTCYDYPMARLLDEAGIPILLVGDSLGMVVLGYPDTTSVTVDEIRHHTAAVARAKPNALMVADLPYMSYENPTMAVNNAKILLEAGADAVKLEGGVTMENQVRALILEGIPVMGHLGMLPQSIRAEGSYKIKGRSEEERQRLLLDARTLEAAGVFAIVLELVEAETAHQITEAVQVPTIGIGSGTACDGQILVTPDLIGSFPWFRPKFAQPRADVASEVKRAAQEYAKAVKAG